MIESKLAENTNIVAVKRDELLEVLKTNRAKHIVEYNAAIKQFRKDVIEETMELLKNNKSGGILKFALIENTRTPISYEKQYDTLIRKYTMSVNDVVYLDDAQFSQYVMDDWSWKHQVSNAFYSAKSVGGARHG